MNKSIYADDVCDAALDQIDPADRPREKLIDKGAAALSDRELLALLLGTGTAGKNVRVLARELLERLEQENRILTVQELITMTGIGNAKACSIVAMLEFGRRHWEAVGTRIERPDDIYPLIRHHADRRQERFLTLSLNGAHEILAIRIVTIGLVNRTIVHPREVFADPILDRASAIIVAHNHPSGQLIPSPEDDGITTRLNAAADILGIDFLDHLIFSENGYISYRQTGRL
ncbi:DNA repair protein RadC [Spirochaetia bacterium]|nr:DNA repair protein RadC [Spirochaetia bacterium]GHU35037.1 DNA repair protein RadC [Spirochaetia bacterium]